MPAAAVVVQLPAMLAQMVEGQRLFEVSGATISDALADLVSQRPALRVHLFDESEGLRPHVLCFHNGEYARGIEGLGWPLSDGDRLTILNSIAGGSPVSARGASIPIARPQPSPRRNLAEDTIGGAMRQCSAARVRTGEQIR